MRFGFTTNIFRYFTHTEVFRRISSRSPDDKIRYCLETAGEENATPRLLAVSLLVLAAGLAVLPLVTTIAQVTAWATAMGLGGGLVMVLFFSVWPRVYGRRHLGRIQGAAQAMTVLASAVGPLLLAWCVEWTGSYGAMFYLLAAAVALTATVAAITPMPQPAGRVD